MTEVHIEGRLGDIVGSYHRLSCSTLREILVAIESNTGKLRKYLQFNKKRYFSIFVDGKVVDPSFFGQIKVAGKKIVILPILMGAVGFTIAAKITALTATAATGAVTLTFAGMVVGSIITAAVSFGLSMIISKMLAPDDPEIVNTTSFVFSQAENVAAQGQPVAVGYGRLRVGGSVISVNLLNVDRDKFDSSTFYNVLSDKTISSSELTEPEQGASVSQDNQSNDTED